MLEQPIDADRVPVIGRDEAKLFDRFVKRATRVYRPLLIERYGDEVATRIVGRATQDYRAMTPEITELSNRLLDGALAGTYEYLALGKAMRSEGIASDEVGVFYTAVYERLVSGVAALARQARRATASAVLALEAPARRQVARQRADA